MCFAIIMLPCALILAAMVFEAFENDARRRHEIEMAKLDQKREAR